MLRSAAQHAPREQFRLRSHRGALASPVCASQRPPPSQKSCERREELPRRSFLGVGLLGIAAVAPASAFDSPYNDVVPEIGLLRSATSGRLRPCPSNYNCVSTSSTSPEQYGAAWSASVSTPAAAIVAISQAVDAIYPGAERRDAETLKDGSEYARFQIKGAFEVPDEVEFLVRPTGPGDRGWKGDTGGLLVTYRSCAGTVKYVYPFLTPIPDGGLQSKRLQRLREELGWRLVGCELVECFPRGQ